MLWLIHYFTFLSFRYYLFSKRICIFSLLSQTFLINCTALKAISGISQHFPRLEHTEKGSFKHFSLDQFLGWPSNLYFYEERPFRMQKFPSLTRFLGSLEVNQVHSITDSPPCSTVGMRCFHKFLFFLRTGVKPKGFLLKSQESLANST